MGRAPAAQFFDRCALLVSYMQILKGQRSIVLGYYNMALIKTFKRSFFLREYKQVRCKRGEFNKEGVKTKRKSGKTYKRNKFTRNFE
jgi:hypothetical protein